MIVNVNHFWTREEVAKDTKFIYLFGDNINDMSGKFVPKSTQAVIRGLPNAIGIPTKKTRGTNTDAYFYDNDADFEIFKALVDKAITEAKARKLPVKISSQGIGTGAAEVSGAFRGGIGRFFEYLYRRLGELA